MFFTSDYRQRGDKKGNLTAVQCIKDVYRRLGIRGFYKGITASYYGISETVIHFVIYEAIKAKLREMKGHQTLEDDFDDRSAIDFFEFMAAGATSKTIATCVAYPHGKCVILMSLLNIIEHILVPRCLIYHILTNYPEFCNYFMNFMYNYRSGTDTFEGRRQ